LGSFCVDILVNHVSYLFLKIKNIFSLKISEEYIILLKKNEKHDLWCKLKISKTHYFYYDPTIKALPHQIRNDKYIRYLSPMTCIWFFLVKFKYFNRIHYKSVKYWFYMIFWLQCIVFDFICQINPGSTHTLVNFPSFEKKYKFLLENIQNKENILKMKKIIYLW
jgi:hypothetical protein